MTGISSDPPGKEPDIVITPSGSQYIVELRAKKGDRKDPDYWRTNPGQNAALMRVYGFFQPLFFFPVPGLYRFHDFHRDFQRLLDSYFRNPGEDQFNNC